MHCKACYCLNFIKMNTLSISQLTLTYGKNVKALNNISLQITNGMFGLLGPNGAGKSSLMKTIVGLQKPDNGSIIFNGTDVIKDPGFIKKSLGYLPQDFGVYPKVSAYDLLEHLAKLKGVTDSNYRKKQIDDLLERVNLSAYKKKPVHSFSGGMKQRFGVAQALLGSPSIIIVDEPTAGLDPEERNRFNTLLSEISEEVIVILSTHLVEDVRNLCSKMAVMNKGSIIATGSPTTMITELDGKIWAKKFGKNDTALCNADKTIISRQLVERDMLVSVFAEKQPEGFIPVTPTLEHVYFKTLNQSNKLYAAYFSF